MHKLHHYDLLQTCPVMASSHLDADAISTQLNCSARLANNAWSVHSNVTSQC